MKKVLCFAFLLISSIYAFSKDKLKEVEDLESIVFYGVDFSNAKVYGSADSPTEFKKAFQEINLLFITEKAKYNVSSSFEKRDVLCNFNLVNELNSNIKKSDIISNVKVYSLSKIQLESIVKSYNIAEPKGVGLIFIAERLDKEDKVGYFHVVFFDEKTKEILYSRMVYGKAGGFGLKSFWASSICKFMKEWTY